MATLQQVEQANVELAPERVENIALLFMGPKRLYDIWMEF
jgi:hypothetical protein